jgi:putative transposase
MSDAVLRVEVGSRLWFDGETWTVSELTGAAVRLLAGEGRYRMASLGELLDRATSVDDTAAGDEPAAVPASVILACLSAKQREQLDREVGLLSPLIGNVDSADSSYAGDRLRRTAIDLGVSLRTLQRRLRRFQEMGPAGLVDQRMLKDLRRSVDPRWDLACIEVLKEFANSSNPSKQTVIRRTNRAFLASVPGGTVPSQSVAYQRVVELDKGRYTFGEAKQRRSVAKRPQGVLGQLRPTRPGEYVLLDGYKLDVFAMEPVTMRWVNTELTVAMDLFDRSIKGVRLRPYAAKSADVASVLFQTLTPQQWGTGTTARTGPYCGVPDNIVLGSVGVLPDTIVIDHGNVYLSEHTMSVCRRLGISIQPALPGKPTDKPALERFFRTLRLSLLDKLTGYKGQNVAARGQDIERGAFYYVAELEQLIREWVGDVYHRSAHAGLCDPRLPKVELSPEEMFNRGLATCGLLRLPTAAELRYDLLAVEWRMIHHYGIDIDGRRYDGAALNPHRGRRSTYGGAHPGKWPFMVDVDDVRQVYFQDPIAQAWHQLSWRLASALNAPFSKDAADYTRRASQRLNRHIDPQQAVEDLLQRWSREEVTDRRERVLAVRLSTQSAVEGSSTPRDRASEPGVIDLLSSYATKPSRGPDHADDLDVFERFYYEHPDAQGLEVFDE